MNDRLQRFFDTLGRVPTDDEAADMVRLSRRGFISLAGVAAAGLWLPASTLGPVRVVTSVYAPSLDANVFFSWLLIENTSPSERHVDIYAVPPGDTQRYENLLTSFTVPARLDGYSKAWFRMASTVIFPPGTRFQAVEDGAPTHAVKAFTAEPRAASSG